MQSSRVRTPTPSPRHRRQMREVQLPDRIYTYRPSDPSAGGMAYLDSRSEIQLTRLWSVPLEQFPEAPPYYREGDPPPLDTVSPPSDDDPADWRTGKKVINVGLVAIFAFVTALTAAIFVPSAIELEDELAGNRALGELAIPLFVLGGALGALIAAPVSEAWGRAPVYWLSGAAFAGLTAACGAASSTAELLAYRFLAGLFGSVPLVVGAATVAEVVPANSGPPARRAVVMAILTAASLLGTAVGPVVDGTLVDAKGWRWVFWAFGAASAVLTVLMVLAVRETCPAAIERRRAKVAARIGAMPEPLAAPLPRGRPVAPPSPVAAIGMGEKKYYINYYDNNNNNSNHYNNNKNNGKTSPWLLRGYVFFSPVAGAVAMYTALLFGCFYLMLASVPFVFGGGIYDLGKRGMELTYLGVGIGALLGLAYYIVAAKMDAARRLRGEHDDKRAPSSCAHCKHCLQEHEAGCDGYNYQEPEDRLRPLRPCAFSVPLGLAIYGWTASAGALWAVPVFGSALVGFGVAGVLTATQLYMVEAFPGFPATAVASTVILRLLMAGGLPVAGPAMISSLGVGWCGTVLAAVTLGLVPVPWLLVRYGDTMRMKFAPRGL